MSVIRDEQLYADELLYDNNTIVLSTGDKGFSRFLGFFFFLGKKYRRRVFSDRVAGAQPVRFYRTDVIINRRRQYSRTYRGGAREKTAAGQ